MKIRLQKEASHPEPPNKVSRRILFQRCMDSIDDVESFLSKWFLGSPIELIKRDNVKEFFAWSMMNLRYEDVRDEDVPELDDYADRIDDMLQQQQKKRLAPGKGDARSLRGTVDAVPMQHRPLVWYTVSHSHSAAQKHKR